MRKSIPAPDSTPSTSPVNNVSTACVFTGLYSHTHTITNLPVFYSDVIGNVCVCVCFSLRRVYIINKEICERTVCAHEELIKGKNQELWSSPTPVLILSVLFYVCWRLYVCYYFCLSLSHCFSPSLFSLPRVADLCRDQFARCGVVALSGQCGTLGSNCGKSCGVC